MYQVLDLGINEGISAGAGGKALSRAAKKNSSLSSLTFLEHHLDSQVTAAWPLLLSDVLLLGLNGNEIACDVRISWGLVHISMSIIRSAQ
jgi:hypothetical protein